MSKTESKVVYLTSLKSLGGGVPVFDLPVKIKRVDGSVAEVLFKIKGLKRTEWAAARDEQIEAIIAKKDETEGEKFTLVGQVTRNVEQAASVILKAASGWSLDDELNSANLQAMEDMIPGALESTLAAIDVALFQGRVGN